jgi:hypothetical protein
MRSRILVICGLLCLLLSPGAWADWLGLMQNQGGGNEIDQPMDARDIDVAFDDANNAICLITQPTNAYYHLLVSRQSYGGNIWVPTGITPIDNRTIQGNSKQPALDIVTSTNGMCVYAQDNSGSTTNAIYGDFYNQDFAIVNSSSPLNPYQTFNAEQPGIAMLGSAGILTYIQALPSGQSRICSSKWENNTCMYWGSSGWTTITSAVLPINGTGTNVASHPHMATSSTGDIYCTFAEESASVKCIYVARYRNGQWYYWGIGGWQLSSAMVATVAISGADTGFDADYPRIVALPSGQMLCVYELKNKTDNNTRIHCSLFNGQSWTVDPSSTPVDAAGSTFSARYADIAATPQGKAICVYSNGNTANAFRHAYASEWDGTRWTAMNAQGPLDALGNSVTPMSPRVTCDKLGNAIAVFQVWEPSAGVNGQSRVMANYFQGPPLVTAVSPDNAKNTGIVTITVQGSNFAGGSVPAQRVNAWLKQAGKPDIPGINVVVTTPTLNFFTASQFTVDFDLTNAPVGDWDLLVQNPDGQQCLIRNALGITWPDLNQAYVYPNPIRFGGTGAQSADHLRFFNLMHTTTIRIYTLDGVLVRSLDKADRQLFVDWDLRNTNGALVAPGVYFYRLESSAGNRKGKFMVIR